MNLARRPEISPYEHGSERTPMDADSSTALREEVQVLEDELARLRETVAALRRRIGERWDDPTDSAEKAALITTAEEQKGFIQVLGTRRADLLRHLGEQR
jgi:hypothetical protein